MAGSKQWTIDQLADSIRRHALTVQGDIAGKKAPVAVSLEYIKAMLYGTKRMPHHWRVAAANVLGVSLNEYENRIKNPIRQPASALGKNKIKPIDFWPHLKWTTKDMPDRSIAALLYGLSKSGIEPDFIINPGQWESPGGFSGYDEMRNTAWQEFSKNFLRMKKEPPIPKPVWHVDEINLTGDSEICLKLQQADFRDVLLTGNYQGLNFNIVTDDNQKRRIEDWLTLNWTPGQTTRPVLPGASQLVVNVMVLTKKRGRTILSRQGPDNPDSAGCWCPSVSIVVNPKIDCDHQMQVDLARAVSRGCKEELGLQTDGKGVVWLALAAGLKYGSITLFGVLESEASDGEIQKNVRLNVKQMERDSTHICQVTDVEFIDITGKEIIKRLSVHNYRAYTELGLALLLWRQNEARFLAGIIEPTK